jgi:hypothetical protein
MENKGGDELNWTREEQGDDQQDVARGDLSEMTTDP